jgi:EXLDI family protein
MPNKTIYVSDGDLELYQRAQELAGGNLSAAIAAALRRYIEVADGRQVGYEEITVAVGHGGVRRKQRFCGVLLGEWERIAGRRAERFRVYRTPRGRFVLHVDRSDEWTSSTSSDNWIRDLLDWRAMLGVGERSWGFVPGEVTLEVADSVEALRGRLPAEFYQRLASTGAARQPAIEDLDI